MFSGRYWSHIQDSGGFFDGPSSFVGARLFENVKILKFQNSEIYTNNMFQNASGFFLDFTLVSWCPKKIILVLGGLDTFRNPEIMEMRSLRFSNNKIGIL